MSKLVISAFFLFSIVSVPFHYYFYTVDNTRKEFTNDEKELRVLVLKNNRSCDNCFISLSQFLAKNGFTENETALIVLADTLKTNRFIYKKLQQLMPLTQNIYFDYTTKSSELFNQYPKTESLFKKFDIHKTPAVILKNAEKLIVYKNEDLYKGEEYSKSFIKGLKSLKNK